MSSLPGTVINGRLVPTDSLDTYYLLEDKYMKGSWRSVADLTERDAITDPRRKIGMAVYVQSEDKIYQLKGGITNSDWQEMVTGGSPSQSTGQGTIGGGRRVAVADTSYVDCGRRV